MLQRATDRPGQGFSVTRYLRNLDWLLLIAAFSLIGIGLTMIYSATHADTNISTPTFYVRSQVEGMILGTILLVLASVIDFSHLDRWRRVSYGVMIALLLLTVVLGDERMGARRWIALPFFDLQTSELAKILVIVSFAGFLAHGVELRDRFRFVLLAVAYVAAPALVVFLQPDLGTAIVFGVILLVMLLVWGIRWRHLGVLLASGVAVVVAIVRVLPTALGIEVLHPYQMQRLLVFLDPERDPSGLGYQLSQSKIAVASGMITGKGYMDGTQTHLNFLPEHHTDFIFAVLGEELGFLGALVVLGLFLVVIWRGMRIASMSKSLYGSLIAAGVVAVIVFQVFVNVGMTVGIMPITGLPLPLVSFGSSSLVVFLTAIGLLESIHVHSRAALYGSRFKGEAYGQLAS